MARAADTTNMAAARPARGTAADESGKPAKSTSGKAGSEAGTPRGRIDKRRAILAAAEDAFTREGYTLASLDTIAVEAGVSKPTIYNHFGGKENLFRTVIAEAAGESRERILSALEDFPADGAELPGRLTAIAHRVVECQAGAKGWALQRLVYAEAARFPDLYDTIRVGGTVQIVEALAGRLARLAHSGHLDLDDPVTAAGQFLALVAGDLPTLTALGTRPVDPDALDRAVAAGVTTFLRAFTPR
ncbi:TetR/AcrR family transcriptional regulator [Yinghuangia soli]|uniref:TetR/AcrR family transcriptional regulator n=1 Tax=Yinghuangia soli TaxID=2908204 RepID=A0AA41PXH6_9ACTN|nr:TetR/AcrR family transcriptional regulator [Yinghuangia soli]MCF2527165.1 TetR/AcrR family transcriptional regulator [Yinghuangia soli]